MGARYLIVGNGAAGTAAAERIRKRDPSGQVTVVTDETRPAYYRPLIPFLIYQGLAPERLRRGTPLPGIENISGQRVIALHPENKSVELENGTRLQYDRLLLATGASPYLPPIPGLSDSRASVLRRWEDAEAIQAAGKVQNGQALVIGGGRVGVKSALALRHLGLQVIVLELLPKVLPLQLDGTGSKIVQRVLEAQGIRFELGRWAVRVTPRSTSRQDVLLDDERHLEADLLVVAAGVRPDVQLAENSGIQIGKGIVVDRHLRTNLPDIYAAGDVVETVDILTGQPIVGGTWTTAVEMGLCAADNMTGRVRDYPGALAVLNALDLNGFATVSVGLVDPQSGDYDLEVSHRGNLYRKLVFKGDRLVGALLLGDIDRAGVFTALIRGQISVGHLKGQMLDKATGYGRFLGSRLAETDLYIRV